MPKPESKVSILVPFYQVERYIERCARSVLEQSYQDIEYIFINDGSSDNSLSCLQKILDDFPQRINQVRIISNTTNKGLAYCRNLGIQECTGSFVFWVDADDWITPSAIQQLIDLQTKTDADIVNGRVVAVGEEESHEIPFSSHSSRMDTLTGILDFSIKPMVWGRLIRTSLYRDHSIQCIEGIDYKEDFQVVPRLFYYAGTVADLDAVIYYYNIANPLSYISMAHSDIRVKLKKDAQDLASIKLIQAFFRERDQRLYKINEKGVVYYLRETIRGTTRTGDRALFLKSLKELKECDKETVLQHASALYRFSRISPSLCWWIKRIRSYFLDPEYRH